jgi:hypothetical protein
VVLLLLLGFVFFVFWVLLSPFCVIFVFWVFMYFLFGSINNILNYYFCLVLRGALYFFV